MSENSHQETIRQINKAQTELKIKLEQVSKLRVDCAKLQLELLKLYKPQCLEILETLRDITAPPQSSSASSCSNPMMINDDDQRFSIYTQ